MARTYVKRCESSLHRQNTFAAILWPTLVLHWVYVAGFFRIRRKNQDMPSIEQRNRTYHITFRLNGQRFRRSLRTVDERCAQASMARLEDNLRRGALGTLELPDDVDVAAFLLSDGRRTKKKPKRVVPRTLGDLLKGFLAQLPDHSIEPSTRQMFEIHIRHLQRVFGNSVTLAELQLADLQRYVNHRASQRGIRGRTLSPATIKLEIVTLNTVWRWGNSNAYIDRPLPKRGLRLPRGIEKPLFQTWEEIERKIATGGLSEAEQKDLWDGLFLDRGRITALLDFVYETARQPFIYPMFVFAAHTGARRSELLRSRIEDVDLDARVVTIREKKRVHGKASVRTVPLSPLTHTVLTDWLAKHPGGQATFCSDLQVRRSRKIRDQYQPLTRDEAHDHFQRTLAGSKWQVLRGWHIFRHSFISNCASLGVDQRMIDAWVGHQTDEMRRRYRHVFPNRQQFELEKVFG
jgi:integrase